MSDLSEERKRQIRQEEEQRLARIKAEEEAYRNQVRSELEGGGPQPPPPVAPPPVSAQPAPPQPQPAPQAQSRPRREPRMSRRARLAFGAFWGLGGLALAWYAYYQGFPIPGLDGPFRSTLTAEGDGAPEPVDRAKWEKSALAYDEWVVGADGKVTTKPDAATTKPVSPRAALAAASGSGGTVERPDPEVRVASRAFALTVPATWTFDEKSDRRWIVHRDLGDGTSIRVNVTDVSDRSGTALEELHAQNVRYVQDWISATGGLTVEDEGDETPPGGITFKFTAMSDPAKPDYYYVALTASRGGRAIWVIMDGPSDVPSDVDKEVEALVASIRLQT